MIAAGLGCRRQCDVRDVLAAVDLALSLEGAQRADLHALYVADFKQAEPALQQAAVQLGKPLQPLTLAQLRIEEPYLLSPSEQVRAHAGVASVSESAALAGARTLSSSAPQLRRARSIVGGASCALAFFEARGSACEPFVKKTT